jgi:hypothetical protein
MAKTTATQPTKYVYLTWKTPEGKTRRSFASAPIPNGRTLVHYSLVTADGDGKNEVLVGFATDSAIKVKPAQFNNHYGELEVVR